jgi:arabinose-5-phosphate isomerase
MQSFGKASSGFFRGVLLDVREFQAGSISAANRLRVFFLKEILRHAKEVIRIEAEAVEGLLDRLDESFLRAVEAILACKGRVVVTGIGKSGLVGRKIVATFISTGTPAAFLHPVEGLHGDLGMVSPRDIVLALSNSGETAEILHLLPSIQTIGSPIISLTGNRNSTLARSSQVVIDVGVEREACPLGLAPTSSTTAALVMGDALAVALMRQKKFGEKDFALFHPGGNLGEKLHSRIGDLMQAPGDIPCFSPEKTVGDFLSALTSHRRDFGFILHPDGRLAGMLLDRDLRKGEIGSPQFLARQIKYLMSANPLTITEEASGTEAIRMMIDHNLTALPVVDKDQRLKGFVTLRDLSTQKDLRNG